MTHGDGGSLMLNALGEEDSSGHLVVLALVSCVCVCVGGSAECGCVAVRVRGEGAGGGQLAGSRRGGSGYPAWPSHPQLARGGRGGLRPFPLLFAFLWQAAGLGLKGMALVWNGVYFS